MALRVVQWNTGIVGAAGVRLIAEHPRLELVGCYAWSDDKVGRDAGELAGTVRLGVEATRDVDVLINPLHAAIPERRSWPCWNPRRFDVLLHHAELRRSGSRSTRRGGEARRGVSTERGSIPSAANAFALLDRSSRPSTASRCSNRWLDELRLGGDLGGGGLGRPVDDPALPAMARAATSVFQDAVEMMATALEAPLDEIAYDVEFAAATASAASSVT